jgi:hypothetical protein
MQKRRRPFGYSPPWVHGLRSKRSKVKQSPQMNKILHSRIDAANHKGGYVTVWRTESRLRREEHVYVARGGGLEPIQSWIDREMGKQTDGAGNGNGANGHALTQAGDAAGLSTPEFAKLLSSLGIVPIS